MIEIALVVAVVSVAVAAVAAARPSVRQYRRTRRLRRGRCPYCAARMRRATIEAGGVRQHAVLCPRLHYGFLERYDRGSFESAPIDNAGEPIPIPAAWITWGPEQTHTHTKEIS